MRSTFKLLYFVKRNAVKKNGNAPDDSLAQQVEHIPFKDGVLGSNPRRITETLDRNGQ